MNIYRQILLKYWGYSAFRPLQEDIIRSVSEGKDTLGLMPTGGGKSITFQVPAMAREGICIVVTPLIALMKDQVENLKKKEIKANAIFSGMTRNEIDITLDNCVYGDIKFLYVSPERLETEMFMARVVKMNVNLLAIDEAHCISQWGYDFRPSYLRIAQIRGFVPDVPLLALTATATPKVVEDIQDKLKFKTKNVFKKSFERKNLVYFVKETEDKSKYLLKIIKKNQGTGIVYVRNRKKTRELSVFMQKHGFSADYYHAGLSNELRSAKQQEWKENKTRIMVSTNAFGMGIDKPDVRFVVHMDLPDSIEAYFQEAGRGGRDEKKAFAVLLYNHSDKLSIKKRLDVNFPDVKDIKKVYAALGNHLKVPYGSGKHQEFGFNLPEFGMQYKLNILKAYNCLKVLEAEGYLELTDEIDNPSKIYFIVGRNDLYKFQVENASFDGFIKLLLRSYSGVFSEYVAIDEHYLAKKSALTRDDVYNYLKKLGKMKIISYIPRKKTPFIIYKEERFEEKSLYISYENLKARKERYIERTEAMLAYCENDHKCRSQQLLAYFGEKDSYRCGQCDVCQRRNELKLSRYEFDLVLEDIKGALHQQSLMLDDLVDSINYSEEKVLKVIQWLIDNEKIDKEEGNRFSWR